MNVKYEVVDRYQTDADDKLVVIDGRFMKGVVNEIAADYTIILSGEPDFKMFADRQESLEHLFFQHLFYQYGKLRTRRDGSDRFKWWNGFDVRKYLQRHEALNKADLERFINRQIDYYSTAQGVVFGQFADELKVIFRQLLSELESKPLTFADILTVSIEPDKRIIDGQWTGSAKDAGIFLAKLLHFNHFKIDNQAEIIRLFIAEYRPDCKPNTLEKEMSAAGTKLKNNDNEFRGYFAYLNK